MQARSFTSMVPVGRTMSPTGVVVTANVLTVGPYKPLAMMNASITCTRAVEAFKKLGFDRDSNSNSVWPNSEKEFTMKIQISNWTPKALTAVLAVMMCVENAEAQESPEIGASIEAAQSVVAPAPDLRLSSDPITTDPNALGSDYFDDYDNSLAPVARTWVLGINVPIFDRDFDGDRLFSFNPADPTQTLSSNDADPNGTSGIEVNLATRGSSGYGFEARYWGLYASAATDVLGGTPTTAINGLSQISDGGVALSDTFNTSDFHSLTRDYSFNNVELNLLRNGKTYSPLGRCLSVEWLHGFRYMQFNESLEYAGVSSSNAIIRSALNSSVENSLFGFQTGGRGEWRLFDRVSFAFGGKLGLFNNHARTGIVATNQTSDLAFFRPVINDGPNANAEFQFGDTKDDLSLMGELDLGIIYQWNQRSRFRLGYRVLGVSDIADAEKNIPANFTDTTVLGSSDTDGDLVLRGGYVGFEVAF